jgi:AraC-like DNA-binding protein
MEPEMIRTSPPLAVAALPLTGPPERVDDFLRLLGIELDEVEAEWAEDREEIAWLRPFRQASGVDDANPALDSMGRAFADALQRQFAADPAAQGRLAAVCERLFVECVRGHLAHLAPEQTGELAALRDPAVGRALSLIHADARRDWTVGVLAQTVNMSRSTFAKRFMAVVGQPPRRYLTTWRMQLAVRRLLETRRTIAQIAYELGYETDTGFGRAFCREFGSSPAAWRRQGGRPLAARRGRGGPTKTRSSGQVAVQAPSTLSAAPVAAEPMSDTR